MSHLWIQGDAGEWTDHCLRDDLVQLASGPSITAIAREQLGSVSGPVLARGERTHGLQDWMLLAAPAHYVRINGARLEAGAHALADRDAIALGDGHTVFFSVEECAQIVAFPGTDDATCCIRCKLPLAPRTPAVRCPGRDCGFWHHQSAEQPCWTYADGCANCAHPTAFDAGFQWTPDEL